MLQALGRCGAFLDDRWGKGPSQSGDDLDLLVYLSNLVGAEATLVQSGGGNTSVKLSSETPFGDVLALAVKGSGFDLRGITRTGFTRLSVDRLAHLGRQGEMTDEAMMAFMGACMLFPHQDPFPSVETPLHFVLPHKVIVHVHDVPTMSLTNVREDLGRRLVEEVFQGQVLYVPYQRPGFPLARAVSQLTPLPDQVHGLALAHHGMVVLGDTPRQCYERLLQLLTRAETFLSARQGRQAALGAARLATPAAPVQEDMACRVLPLIRGSLGRTEKVILHWDRSPRFLEALSRERFPDLARHGAATPEHILRAGRRPLWLDLSLEQPVSDLTEKVRQDLESGRAEYMDYHERHARPGDRPLPDWAKIVLIPGLGVVGAFKDKHSAQVAVQCYAAVLQTLENSETLDAFCFLPETDVHAFEHWPLERRKVEEAMRREQELLVPRHVVLIVGAASGIGEAAAWRFAEEGGHVMVADLDAERAAQVAAAIDQRFPCQATAAAVDVRDENSIAALIRRTVLEYGGLDILFYTPGLAPRFAPLAELERRDLEAQMQVHFTGALLTLREASRVMQQQGTGGSMVFSVSKAALAPGKEAAAYGGSKAALQHTLRTAALELGASGIRVNSINADQVDTPLFRRFATARAAAGGQTLEEQLGRYRERNALGVSLIPARAVAELAVLLGSQRFAYTTGDILTIDGGLPEAFPR